MKRLITTGILTPGEDVYFDVKRTDLPDRAAAANLAVQARNNGTYDRTREATLRMGRDQVYFDSYHAESGRVTIDTWQGFVVAGSHNVRVLVR
jgi:hypothetical protein